MINLLEETKEDMEQLGYNESDVIFIGSRNSGHQCSWGGEFCVLANFVYDEGFGGVEIASDLIIVFKDGSWLERGEYDGSEWWESRRPFTLPLDNKPIAYLCGGSLAEANE